MVFKKYLLVLCSLTCINLTYAACTNSQTCLDDGVNYSNSNTAGAASNINNSVIESAVGADRITDANSTRDSIQNTMGGNYKNIDGMNNAGNTKAAACQGKTTQECSAYNYYNDPLTKQGQDSIKDAVSMASDLINKKITENVEIKGYCASNPNDSICKMCAKDPSQAMCQAGNKCTTISYKSTGVETKHACEVIGQRGYACNSWVDNVISHYDYVPPSPIDGTVLAQATNVDNSKTYCMVNAKVIANEALTRGGMVLVTVTNQNNDYPYGPAETNVNMTMAGADKNYLYQNTNNGNTNKTVRGDIYGATCSGNNCTMNVNTSCLHHQLGGNDWDRAATVTLNYIKPTLSSNQLVIDNVIWKDNCAQ